eukprot:5288725-Prymnesium_polylepis.1
MGSPDDPPAIARRKISTRPAPTPCLPRPGAHPAAMGAPPRTMHAQGGGSHGGGTCQTNRRAARPRRRRFCSHASQPHAFVQLAVHAGVKMDPLGDDITTDPRTDKRSPHDA